MSVNIGIRGSGCFGLSSIGHFNKPCFQTVDMFIKCTHISIYRPITYDPLLAFRVLWPSIHAWGQGKLPALPAGCLTKLCLEDLLVVGFCNVLTTVCWLIV